MSGIPWRVWLHTAQRLGLMPHEFWRLSLLEWLAMLSAQNSAMMSRADLAHLMGAFPDKENKND